MAAEIRLTDDADYMLCVLYDAYKFRRKNGESSFESRLFGGSECIQRDYIQQWPTDDIDDAARELSEKGLASCLFADNALAEFAREEPNASPDSECICPLFPCDKRFIRCAGVDCLVDIHPSHLLPAPARAGAFLCLPPPPACGRI